MERAQARVRRQAGEHPASPLAPWERIASSLQASACSALKWEQSPAPWVCCRSSWDWARHVCFWHRAPHLLLSPGKAAEGPGHCPTWMTALLERASTRLRLRRLCELLSTRTRSLPPCWGKRGQGLWGPHMYPWIKDSPVPRAQRPHTRSQNFMV